MRLGDTAPDFTSRTSDGAIFNFHKWLDQKWCVFFSHPADFTPVCTTEICRLAQIHDQFHQRNTKLLGLSVDTMENHERWINDIEHYSGTKVNFEIISDIEREIAAEYDMIDQDFKDSDGLPLTVRSVFFIDPNKKIRTILMYPSTVGRNTEEIVRIIDALQTVDKYDVAIPVDWNVGSPAIIPPKYSCEEGEKKFKTVMFKTKYLRFTNIATEDKDL